MRIEYFGNYDEMSDRAAEIVAKQVGNGLRGSSVLGLPTGSTPLGMYKKLIKMNEAGKVDFSETVTYNLDEYYPIKKDHPQSYYKFMCDNFFDKININPENINIPNGETDNIDLECKEYEFKIRGGSGLLHNGIDLMILGLGANGHIGFNEPGDVLLPDTHIADLTEDTREMNKRFFDSIDKVPTKAITMGIGSILKSKKILLLVSGDAKKRAFKKFLDTTVRTRNPVSFLHLHKDVTVLSDIQL